jgi:cell division septation protein DedD
MSGAGKNGGEGGGSRRLYKLVGAVVVAIAIGAALVPLWMGGGEDSRTQVVEVEPEVLGERSGSSSGSPATSEDSAEAGAGTGGGTDDKWWQAQEEGETDSPASGSGSSPSAPPSQAPEGDSEPANQAGSGTGSSREAPTERATAESEPAPAPKPEPEPDPDPEQSAPEPEPHSQEQVAKAEGPYWTVMVGSFRNADNARQLSKKLRQQGFSSEVVAKTVKGAQWNRVYAGHVSTRDEAEALVPRLKEAGYEDMLVLKAE